MNDNDIVSLHLCVDWNSGSGRVVPWETGLCSNCRRGDPRVFNLAVPRDLYESTKVRVENEYKASLNKPAM